MELAKIIAATKKPKIYSKGTAEMWTDPYISSHLLEMHLNPDVELASRRATTIHETVDWIQAKIPAQNLDILDLGCGPGLYAEKFAAKGHHVTGMDISASSIRHAADSAVKKKLDITYRQQNYLKLDDENRYDLVMMIFTDFGVLAPKERKTLLANVHRALKPGGMFLFDVLNENYQTDTAESRSWEAAFTGFWSAKPYLALTETFYYEEQNALLSQHSIIDENEDISVYRFWNHTFTNRELEEIVAANGFSVVECYDRVIPGCEMYASEDVTFCIAQK